MKLTLHNFKSDVPREKVCRPGVEYEAHEADVGPDDVPAFFDGLVYPRDSFYLEVPEYIVNFWKHEQAVWVEITGAEFWATSEVSLDEAKAIIEALDLGESFGPHVPSAGREWDAYSLPAPETRSWV